MLPLHLNKVKHAPVCFQQPGPFIYTAPNGFVPSSVVDSTTLPHIAAMSVGTLNPSVEMPATFYTHGSTVTFQSANSFSDPPFTDLSTCILLVILKYYSIRSVPLAGQSRVRQTMLMCSILVVCPRDILCTLAVALTLVVAVKEKLQRAYRSGHSG